MGPKIHGNRRLNEPILNKAVGERMESVDLLMTLAESVNTSIGDQLDKLGQLRSVEKQLTVVRRKLVNEARAANFTWQEIAISLDHRMRGATIFRNRGQAALIRWGTVLRRKVSSRIFYAGQWNYSGEARLIAS